MFAWEDVKAMFNGGSRKRITPSSSITTPSASGEQQQEPQPAEKVENGRGKSQAPPPPSKKPKTDKPTAPKPTMTSPTPSTSGQSKTLHPLYSAYSANPSLLARLNAIAPVTVAPVTVAPVTGSVTKPAAEAPLPDYVWNTSRLWSPYLNPMPFHPYLYNYNYLLKSEPAIPPALRNRFQSPESLPIPPPQSSKTTEAFHRMKMPEDDSEPFVDVEATDQSLP